MTSKEALEELRFQVGNITYFTRDLQITTFKVRDSGLFEIIAKDLEVLEIIKKKLVVVSLIPLCNNAHDYSMKTSGYESLTDKEFKLIKEWLENDNAN